MTTIYRPLAQCSVHTSTSGHWCHDPNSSSQRVCHWHVTQFRCWIDCSHASLSSTLFGIPLNPFPGSLRIQSYASPIVIYHSKPWKITKIHQFFSILRTECSNIIPLHGDALIESTPWIACESISIIKCHAHKSWIPIFEVTELSGPIPSCFSWFPCSDFFLAKKKSATMYRMT